MGKAGRKTAASTLRARELGGALGLSPRKMKLKPGALEQYERMTPLGRELMRLIVRSRVTQADVRERMRELWPELKMRRRAATEERMQERLIVRRAAVWGARKYAQRAVRKPVARKPVEKMTVRATAPPVQADLEALHVQRMMALSAKARRF